MTQIDETQLPGVGTRLEFVTHEGNRVGVIHHRSGRRELFLCRADDPDVAALTLELDDDESRALAESLGASPVMEVVGQLQHQIEGLAIDWLSVSPDSPYEDASIGDTRARTRTGVSIVAVIRDTTTFPAPGPQFTLEANDVMVVVGTPEGISQLQGILAEG